MDAEQIVRFPQPCSAQLLDYGIEKRWVVRDEESQIIQSRAVVGTYNYFVFGKEGRYFRT